MFILLPIVEEGGPPLAARQPYYTREQLDRFEREAIELFPANYTYQDVKAVAEETLAGAHY